MIIIQQIKNKIHTRNARSSDLLPDENGSIIYAFKYYLYEKEYIYTHTTEININNHIKEV